MTKREHDLLISSLVRGHENWDNPAVRRTLDLVIRLRRQSETRRLAQARVSTRRLARAEEEANRPVAGL